MRYVSLFSGIGGIDLGLDRAGMTCAYQVEIDPYCRKVLAKHWPDVPRWDDIKTFPRTHAMSLLEKVDMVAGGFPCTPVSHAGKKRGERDERWLWPEMRRVLALVSPAWCLVENVGGLLSAGDVRGDLFGGILRDLADLGYGHIEWHSISAAQCGACHVRPRIWVLAHSTGVRQPGPGEPIHASDPTPIITREAVDALHGRFAREWEIEPRVGRVADGVPSRVDRLRGLGNAVVPQVVEFIGRSIMDREDARHARTIEQVPEMQNSTDNRRNNNL
jgi:DNA (cytosine-5)-methyltransferase 1